VGERAQERERNDLSRAGVYVAIKRRDFQQWAVPEEVEENAGLPSPETVVGVVGEVDRGENGGVELQIRVAKTGDNEGSQRREMLRRELIEIDNLQGLQFGHGVNQ